MNLFGSTIERSAGSGMWIRMLSLALVVGFGAFIVGCSTMDDVRAEEPMPANFGIEITSAPDTVTAGEEIQVRYRVRNTGMLEGTQNIQFSMDGQSLSSRSGLRLQDNQSRTGTFSYMTDDGDVGQHQFRVASQDAWDSVNVNVEPKPTPAMFGVEITSAPESVTAGDDIAIRYRVRNTGQTTGTQNILFSMDGRDLTSRTNLELADNQSRTGTFRITTSDEHIGDRLFRVSSQDAHDSARVRVESKPLVLSSDVLFDFDSAELRSATVSELDRVANSMRNNPDSRIRIEGHTDSVGSREYNQALSERRAQAVADYLAQRNVPRNRMTVEGKGELSPTATNQTSEGRQENRRVEIYTY